jgi:hypothetical protein
MNQVELCSVTYLIDRRDQCRILLTGIANATNRAVGIIHSLEIDVGGVSTRGSFAVLEGASVTGILGIDWLTHNHAMIDVADDSMLIQGRRIKLVDP